MAVGSSQENVGPGPAMSVWDCASSGSDPGTFEKKMVASEGLGDAVLHKLKKMLNGCSHFNVNL